VLRVVDVDAVGFEERPGVGGGTRAAADADDESRVRRRGALRGELADVDLRQRDRLVGVGGVDDARVAGDFALDVDGAVGSGGRQRGECGDERRRQQGQLLHFGFPLWNACMPHADKDTAISCGATWSRVFPHDSIRKFRFARRKVLPCRGPPEAVAAGCLRYSMKSRRLACCRAVSCISCMRPASWPSTTASSFFICSSVLSFLRNRPPPLFFAFAVAVATWFASCAWRVARRELASTSKAWRADASEASSNLGLPTNVPRTMPSLSTL